MTICRVHIYFLQVTGDTQDSKENLRVYVSVSIPEGNREDPTVSKEDWYGWCIWDNIPNRAVQLLNRSCEGSRLVQVIEEIADDKTRASFTYYLES